MRRLFVLAAAIAWIGIPPYVGAQQPDQPMDGGMMGGQGMWQAPSSATDQQNPVTANRESIAAGKSLFDRYCSSCHGSDGKGGAIGPDLMGPGVQNQTDGALFWKITQGSSPMPSFEATLTPHQRWEIVNYIRMLAQDAASVQSARPLAQDGQGGHMNGYGHMMDHWSGGWIMWLVSSILVIVLVYLLVRSLGAGGSRPTSSETPLDILKKRYARGEITKEQLDEMKKNL
jgi:mono/diheme cytochrome c family protein